MSGEMAIPQYIPFPHPVCCTLLCLERWPYHNIFLFLIPSTAPCYVWRDGHTTIYSFSSSHLLHLVMSGEMAIPQYIPFPHPVYCTLLCVERWPYHNIFLFLIPSTAPCNVWRDGHTTIYSFSSSRLLHLVMCGEMAIPQYIPFPHPVYCTL